MASVQKQTQVCLIDLRGVKYIETITESDGNSEKNIDFRKKLYGWEESLHDEK